MSITLTQEQKDEFQVHAEKLIQWINTYATESHVIIVCTKGATISENIFGLVERDYLPD